MAVFSSTDSAVRAGSRRHSAWWERYGLLIVAASPVAANLIGSAFNILYNALQIEPLLSPTQNARFHSTWLVFNCTVYPIAVTAWVAPLWRLRKLHRALRHGETVDRDRLAAAQRQVINLPWRILIVAATCWLICMYVFPAVLAQGAERLDRAVVWHLITSFWTAGLIAVTHSFFAVELTSQKTLFPVFFRAENPAKTPGAYPLSITARGVLWALSAVVSPVVSLLLLLIVPEAHRSLPLFGLGVATIAILYGLATSWMMGKLVALPVRALREALQRVGEGDLHARVHLLRADDFGHLIEGFNRMADGLREREQLQQTFGRHVGRQVAREIMAQGDGLGGSELEITAMFVDIRNFTAHSASHTPAEVVSALNVFFSEAVDIVESHGGLVNKFLGDGLMALFGIGSNRDLHADRAVTAARALLCCLHESREELTRTGWPELAIGIGVNSGPAVVGSVGSPRRQEYTAIGDTVNVASRVETLTKQLERPLLITAATRQRLALQYPLQAVPPQRVRGKEEPLELFAVAAPEPGETLAEFSLTASWTPG